MIVRELELDLDAFEGPFDLLLTLVLRDELDLAEVDVAGIVVAFIERRVDRDELDLEACGEFLVLVAALLELKARALFPEEEAELAELGPEEAAEELARRLAEYRRMKEAAGWLAERLGETRDRFFASGLRRSRRVPSGSSPRRMRASSPERCARWPSSRPPCRCRTWLSGSRRYPSSSSASAPCSTAAAPSTSTPKSAVRRGSR